LFSDRWTPFFVTNSLVQDQPDQSTLSMGRENLEESANAGQIIKSSLGAWIDMNRKVSHHGIEA
jgi:hypothetical protein